MVSRLRADPPRGDRRRPLRAPDRSVDWPTLLDAMASPAAQSDHTRATDPVEDAGRTGRVHACPLRLLVGAAVAHLGAGRQQRRSLGLFDARLAPDRLVVVGARSAASPWSSAPGRMALSALGARWLLRGVSPGDYPRGGRVHLRFWLAERLADELGATNLAGAALMPTYARWLGAKVGRDVDLHSRAARHRAAHPRQRLLGRARGRPDRATGSTATCCTSAPSRSVPGPGSAPAARWARARWSASAPRSRPARRCSAASRPRSSGRARRRSR